MVGLSVGRKLPSPEVSIPLRDAATWFPEIPPPDLCLNEDEFHGKEPATNPNSIYPPLCWFSFGGPHGSLLRSLAGISATSSYQNFLNGFGFAYFATDENDGLQIKPHGYQDFIPHNDTLGLHIDGPGGGNNSILCSLS